MSDWTGNSRSVWSTNGAGSHSTTEREHNDYYATMPKATTLLTEIVKFAPNIWEPACGEGHMAEPLKQAGYNVISTDLIERGYGMGGGRFSENRFPAMR